MKYIWQDLEKPLNAFTVRSATMRNLVTGKIIQYYSANTKIVLVQKCITPNGTYYRAGEAARNHLNYAFEAEAFGLPNEIAPLEPDDKLLPKKIGHKRLTEKKTNNYLKAESSKSGEKTQHKGFFFRLFRGRNG